MDRLHPSVALGLAMLALLTPQSGCDTDGSAPANGGGTVDVLVGVTPGQDLPKEGAGVKWDCTPMWCSRSVILPDSHLGGTLFANLCGDSRTVRSVELNWSFDREGSDAPPDSFPDPLPRTCETISACIPGFVEAIEKSLKSGGWTPVGPPEGGAVKNPAGWYSATQSWRREGLTRNVGVQVGQFKASTSLETAPVPCPSDL